MSLLHYSRPSPLDGYYDVFLSFRGSETRKEFTTNLYYALRQHEIHTFMDEDLMGEEIDTLLDKIAQSRMAIVIYSKEFASSHWCLKELETILQRKKEQKMMLTPIFYKINLDEVKNLTGKTAEYLNKHLEKHDESTVQTWKVAITNFGRVSGLAYKHNDNRTEREFIEHVIDKIKNKLTRERQQTQEHSVDQSSKGVKDLVISQWPSSSNQGQPEGMVMDKRTFTYGEILKITNNLERLIARGGLGDVYSGKLMNGAAVAVKIFPGFLVQKIMTNQSAAEAYLRNQLSLRHENVVSLVGYCCDGENVALIYEFMENENLRMHLSGASPRLLTWKDRLGIARDIAEGLQYLHGTNSVTYGNLQITDILFDEKMTVKILLCPCGREASSISTYDSYISSLIADGASFLSTNPLHRAVFNKKLDLHNFAMILHELVTGHPPPLTTWQNFVSNLSQGNLIADSRLDGVFNKLSMVNVVQLAFTCAQMENFMEPKVSDVLETLKGQSRLVRTKEWFMGS